MRLIPTPCMPGRRRPRATFAALGLLAVFAGAPLAMAAEQAVRLLDLTTTVPAHWVAGTPTSTMRLAEFSIPATGGAGEVSVVIYHFGVGQGGTVEANVQRWVSQFTNPDGSPVQPVIEPLSGPLPATLVQLRGNYARGVGMGPTGESLPDQMLLAAVVETPEGNLYPQMHGPAALVLAEKPAFVAFIAGLQPATEPAATTP